MLSAAVLMGLIGLVLWQISSVLGLQAVSNVLGQKEKDEMKTTGSRAELCAWISVACTICAIFLALGSLFWNV